MRVAIGQAMEESNTFVRDWADPSHVCDRQLLHGDDGFEPENRSTVGRGGRP